MNHVESECFTKKRDEGKKRKSNKTKADEAEELDGRASVCYIMVKLAGDSKWEKEGCFQYNTATSHQITNKLHLIRDIQDANIRVTALGL